MTRVDLNKFDPTKLKPGKGRGFEVRSKTTGHKEYHYFYRFETGELFQTLVKGYNQALALKNQYAKELLEKKWRVSLNVTGWGKIGVWEPPIWQKKFAGVFGYFSGSGIFGGFNCLYIFYLLLGMNTQRASSLNLAINMEGR